MKMQLEGVAEALVNVDKGRDIGATAMDVMRMTTDQQDVDETISAKVAKRRNPEFRK